MAIAPPTQPPDATEGARDSPESHQQSSTVSPTSRTGVIRGLTPLEAGAARAIPRTVTAETSAFEEHYPQPEQHVRTATEYSNYVNFQRDVQETTASHAYHEDTENSREKHDNDTYYQNRQDRAEWRERRRLRRRMGIEAGYLYDNGVQRAPKRPRSERDEPSMPRTRSR